MYLNQRACPRTPGGVEKTGKKLVSLSHGYLLTRTRIVIGEMPSALITLAHTGYRTGLWMEGYSAGEVLGRGMVVLEFQGSSFVKKQNEEICITPTPTTMMVTNNKSTTTTINNSIKCLDGALTPDSGKKEGRREGEKEEMERSYS